jgi:predicted Zn-dependent protease
MTHLVALLLAIAACLPAFAGSVEKDPTAIGQRNVAGAVNFYSIEKELALGKQLALEVEKQARIVDDPIVAEYINRIGQNLVRNSDAEFPVTFRLIESDEINAFTLPGGFIFINTGLVKLTANEAELASALAHEIGHAAARHATRQATRDELMSIGTLPLVMLGACPASPPGRSRAWLCPWLSSTSPASSNPRRISWVSSISGKPATIRAPAWISSRASRPPNGASRAASQNCFAPIR